MSKEDRQDPSSARLDAILRLMLENQRDKNEDIKIGDQILILEDSGLKPTEAGKILGIEGDQLSKYVKGANNQKLRKKLAGKRKGAANK